MLPMIVRDIGRRMKNLLQQLRMIFVLMFISCSTAVERMPAEVGSELFNEVFSFESVATDSKTDMEEQTKKTLNIYAFSPQERRRIDFIKVKTLPNNAAFKVDLIRDLDNGMMIYQISNTPQAYKDSFATTAMMNFIIGLMEGKDLGNGYAAFEMYYNAKNGDPIALDNFIKIKTKYALEAAGDHENLIHSSEYKLHQLKMGKLKEKLADDIKDLKKKRALTHEKRKIVLDALDKAPEGKQFRALIAKNDRKGAMSVLKKYLPWEEMAPFEKQFWENYIAITENPLPIEQRVIIYRGLDEDYIHRATVGAKELSEKEAILSGNAFVMASGMVKNQGSWNRRLRSLKAMNQKFIATVGSSDEFAQSARISVMFENHATEPKGSPFISLTPQFATAENFGSQRISSYLIDPRLLNFNYASVYDTEYEFLIPLSTFPDDLVAIADTELIPPNPGHSINSKAYLEKKLEEVVVKNYGEDKKTKIIAQIKKNSYDFFKLKFPYGKDVKAPGVGTVNKKFYKDFLTEKDPKQPMKPNGELTCKDLIELFWMAN